MKSGPSFSISRTTPMSCGISLMIPPCRSARAPGSGNRPPRQGNRLPCPRPHGPPGMVGQARGPDWRSETQAALRLNSSGSRGKTCSGLQRAQQSRHDVRDRGRFGAWWRKAFGSMAKATSRCRRTSRWIRTKAWTVEVALKPDKKDGMVLARRQVTGLCTVAAKWQAVFHSCGRWETGNSYREGPLGRLVHITAVIRADRTIAVYVNGVLAGTKSVPDLIEQDPNDGMQSVLTSGVRSSTRFTPVHRTCPKPPDFKRREAP